MTYFTSAELAGIQSDPQNKMTLLWSNNRNRFLQSLGAGVAWVPEDHQRLMFCALVAFDLKPYANSSATTLSDILAAQGLDCDNYALLAWYLNQILNPFPASTFQPAFVGLNGGAVGNHCQIMIGGDPNKTPGVTWALMDPTYGLMVAGWGYDKIMSGIPVQPGAIADFRSCKDGTGWPVADSALKTLNALKAGTYKPSDELYYHRTLATMLSGSLSSPQADLVAA